MLLLGGDRTTLVAICDNLKNGIPLVVVRVRVFHLLLSLYTTS